MTLMKMIPKTLKRKLIQKNPPKMRKKMKKSKRRLKKKSRKKWKKRSEQKMKRILNHLQKMHEDYNNSSQSIDANF